MNALSLFSGIGGLDLAAECAGIKTVAMCERDPFCRKVLRKHWSDVPIFEDVKTLSKEVLVNAGVLPIGIIHGGFPCQPFSVAGNQKGRDDDRYLWPEFSRLIEEIGPVWVVAENVSGIIKLAADEICADLERLGYEVGIWNFEAAAVGAPHRRARVFFVAHAGHRLFEGSSVAGEICKEHEGGASANTQRSDSTFVANAISSREPQPQGSVGELRGRIGNGGEDVPDADCERREEQQSAISAEREREAFRPVERSGWWELEPDVGRVAHGIPSRVDRLRALGNAVVPQQAEPIFKAIVEADREVYA